MDKQERYRLMIEKSGSHTGAEAVQLAKDIAAIEETMTVAEKDDRFITSPDGMFFLIDPDGFTIAFGISEFSLPKEAEVTTSLLAPEAVGGEYAIVRFGSPTKAEIFSAGSLFEARGRAEDEAKEQRTVALAFAAGTYNGTRPLFRSLAFVDYIFDDEKALEPSANTIQALAFAKSFDADAASAWSVDHGLPGLQMLKAEQSTVQNKAAAGFHAGSLITRQIGDGIVAVLGRPRKSGKGEPAKVDEAVKAIDKASREVESSGAGDGQNLSDQVKQIQDTLGGLVKQLTELDGTGGAGAPAATPPPPPTPGADAADLQKGAGDDVEVKRFIPFTVIKDDERIVKGLVYEPNVVDAHGDFMTVAAVKQMAHDFMERYRADETAGIDKDHDSEVRQNIPMIESAIARKGDPDFSEGAWFIAVKVKDDAIWKEIKAGTLNGFSFAGLARARPVEAQAAAA